MTRFDSFLAFAESRRLVVCAAAAVQIAAIVWLDLMLPQKSVGFLLLFPILLSAAALNGSQMVALAVFCGKRSIPHKDRPAWLGFTFRWW
jgi:hypothetical protein